MRNDQLEPYKSLPLRKCRKGYQFYAKNELGQDVSLTCKYDGSLIFERASDGFICGCYMTGSVAEKRGAMRAAWLTNIKTGNNYKIPEVVSEAESQWIFLCIQTFELILMTDSIWGEKS